MSTSILQHFMHENKTLLFLTALFVLRSRHGVPKRLRQSACVGDAGNNAQGGNDL